MNRRKSWIGPLLVVIAAGCQQSWEGTYREATAPAPGLSLRFGLDIIGTQPDVTIDYTNFLLDIRSGIFCELQALGCRATVDQSTFTLSATACPATVAEGSGVGCVLAPETVDIEGEGVDWNPSQILQIALTDPFGFGPVTVTRCEPDVDC